MNRAAFEYIGKVKTLKFGQLTVESAGRVSNVLEFSEDMLELNVPKNSDLQLIESFERVHACRTVFPTFVPNFQEVD
jgi:hypothetical protein